MVNNTHTRRRRSMQTRMIMMENAATFFIVIQQNIKEVNSVLKILSIRMHWTRT